MRLQTRWGANESWMEQATEIAMPNSARTMPNSARDGASWNQSDEFRKLHSWLRDQRQNHIDERYPELGEELDSLMKPGQKTSVQKREGPQSGPSGGHVGPSSSGKKTRRKGHASSKKGAKLRLLSPQVQYSKPSPEFLAVKAWVVEEQIRTGRSNFGVVTGAPPPRAGLAQTPTGSLTKTPLGTARSIGSMISSCSSDSGDCMPTTDKIGQTTPLVSKSAQAAQSIPVLPLATATANL
ncbi:unnamed protein product [Prorocentrum cordatum]|uniref:Uncharacterized protein n=1 Tax=Prorocentrum cordatum TaxID=2364126 RepID=A0ABN9T3J4_9DINO|nr:unnamed protein product [Polarella glacialis]